MKREIIWTWAAEMDAQEAFIQTMQSSLAASLSLACKTSAAIRIG